MKFSFQCRVESTMTIPERIKLVWDEMEILFLPQEGGLFNGIRITARMMPGDYGTHVVRTPREYQVHKRSDKQLEEKMLTKLKLLESSLAFCWPVQRIRWHSPIETFIS